MLVSFLQKKAHFNTEILASQAHPLMQHSINDLLKVAIIHPSRRSYVRYTTCNLII